MGGVEDWGEGPRTTLRGTLEGGSGRGDEGSTTPTYVCRFSRSRVSGGPRRTDTTGPRCGRRTNSWRS